MDFKPILPDEPEVMDARIFRSEPMGLREDMLSIPLDQRFSYDLQQNLFFINFERFSVRSRSEIRAIIKAVEDKLAPLGHRVYAIVNYDNFTILPELLDEYSAAARSLVDRFYFGVSRYTTSGFLRMKLGEALEKRGVAPHIFESAAEAESDLQAFEKTAAEELLDCLVRKRERLRRAGEAQRFPGANVDDELERRSLNDGQIARCVALENTATVHSY